MKCTSRCGFPGRFFWRSFWPVAAEAETTRRLASPDRPEAFIASNGLILLGIFKAARALGLARGAGPARTDDVAIAGFDNETWTDLVGSGRRHQRGGTEDQPGSDEHRRRASAGRAAHSSN